MELLLRMFLCLLTFFGKAFGDEIGFEKISCKEDENVILPCAFKERLTTKRFDWKKDGKDVLLCEYGKVSPSRQDEQFKGRVSHFPDQLNSGNASISIKKAKVSDNGNYTCLHIDSAKSYKIELTVVCTLKDRTNDPERKYGTCSKPSFSILKEISGGMQVQCAAHGAYPEPDLELQNSALVTVDAEAPKISQNGSYFDIILQAVVTKRDFYSCVVRQKDICHQISSDETLVIMPSGEMGVKGLAVGVCGLVVGVLGIIAAAAFYYKYQRNKKSSDETDGRTNGARSSSSSACNTDNKIEGVRGSEGVPLKNDA